MKKCLIAFVAIFTLSVSSCGDGFKKGQTVTVVDECIWAYDVVAYDKMMGCCLRRDSVELEKMEKMGKVGILKFGEKGIVTDYDKNFEKTKIQLKDGKTVWVASKFLR